MTMTTTTLRTEPVRRNRTFPARRLQASFAAVRISFTWMGLRKTLTADQKAQAAEPFGAENQVLSAAKKILDTRHPAFREVSALRHQIQDYWKSLSLPYPEPGLRLIRQDQVEAFSRRMTELQEQLHDAVAELDQHYASLQETARQQLGSLFNPADYPPSLRALFGVDWDFPSIDPPDYLLRLNPRLYEEERRRITARFEEAVRLAEQAFTGELSKLVHHLVERLQAGPEGPKVFRDSAVGNLREFFERFKSLSVRSDPELDELVATAERALSGVGAQDLRDNSLVRQQIAGQLSQVGTLLESLMVDAPRRKILRATPSARTEVA